MHLMFPKIALWKC